MKKMSILLLLSSVCAGNVCASYYSEYVDFDGNVRKGREAAFVARVGLLSQLAKDTEAAKIPTTAQRAQELQNAKTRKEDDAVSDQIPKK